MNIMEIFSVKDSGLKVGDVCELVRAGHIQMKITDTETKGGRVSVLLDGVIIVEDFSMSNGTDFAKRLNNPNLQDSTHFHTPREWTFNGKRLSTLIEGHITHEIQGSDNLSSDSRNKNTVNVVGQTCETCFTQTPLTGVCDFC